MKPCSHCRVVKSYDRFHKSKTASDGRASWCADCCNTIFRFRPNRVRNNPPEVKRKWMLQTRYRMTPEDVAMMLHSQNGNCALCDVRVVNTRFHIDHSHETGRIRGILCHRCNIRLGGWDDPIWRARAIPYMGVFNGAGAEILRCRAQHTVIELTYDPVLLAWALAA